MKGSCNSATRKHTVFARFGSSNWHCLVFWHSACRLRVSSQILGKSGSVEYWWWFGPEVLVTEDDHAGGKVSANSDHKENAESWILFFFVLQEIAESQMILVHQEKAESQILFFVFWDNSENQIMFFDLQENAEIQKFVWLPGRYLKSNFLFLFSGTMPKVKYCFLSSRKMLKFKYFLASRKMLKVNYCFLSSGTMPNVKYCFFVLQDKCLISNISGASRKMVKVKYCFMSQRKFWKPNIFVASRKDGERKLFFVF